jgi:hypothetical protein
VVAMSGGVIDHLKQVPQQIGTLLMIVVLSWSF